MATLPMNDLGNWAIGQLFPTWEFPLMRDSRTMDLTGVTANQISLIIYNSAKTQTGTGAGTFVINNAKPGVVTYTQQSGDMASAGTFYLRVKVNYNGSTPDYSDYVHINISA